VGGSARGGDGERDRRKEGEESKHPEEMLEINTEKKHAGGKSLARGGTAGSEL
jgi:hypothetical protein